MTKQLLPAPLRNALIVVACVVASAFCAPAFAAPNSLKLADATVVSTAPAAAPVQKVDDATAAAALRAFIAGQYPQQARATDKTQQR